METRNIDAPRRIDARIAEPGDWRGEVLARIRRLIHEAVPDVVEEWKWRGVPVWSHEGILCTGETCKAYVKLTFARGARWTIPRGCSMRVLTAMSAAPSTFRKVRGPKARGSTRRRSRRWSPQPR